MVQLYKNFSLDFWPYLSNTVELRHGSCANNKINYQLNTAVTTTSTMVCNDNNHLFQNLDAYSASMGCFACRDYIAQL